MPRLVRTRNVQRSLYFCANMQTMDKSGANNNIIDCIIRFFHSDSPHSRSEVKTEIPDTLLRALSFGGMETQTPNASFFNLFE